MTITTERFGRSGTEQVDCLRIANRGGSHIALIPNGARLIEAHFPDRDGRLADLVLGFDSAQEYLDSATYAGSTAGRYANRIIDARFVLDGQPVTLEANEGRNHVHGGSDGLDRQVWQHASDAADNSVTFTLHSPDGHAGYPGAVDIAVTYRLHDDTDVLDIEFTATTSAPTVLNLVNHAYWNLAGHDSGSVLDQTLLLNAPAYVPVDGALLATGEIHCVHGTAFDFTSAHPIGEFIADVPGGDGTPSTTGYDHNWVLDGPRHELHLAALAADPASGRRLRLSTTEPGIQMYSAGYMKQVAGKQGATYDFGSAFTLETQTFPCAPNHPWFPSARVDPGTPYRHVMRFEFDALG